MVNVRIARNDRLPATRFRQKQRAYERRRRRERTRKQKRAGRLLGLGITQEQAAAAVGVSSRTLRNWKAAPTFCQALERAQKRPAAPASALASSRQQAARTSFAP